MLQVGKWWGGNILSLAKNNNNNTIYSFYTHGGKKRLRGSALGAPRLGVCASSLLLPPDCPINKDKYINIISVML